MKAFMVYAEGIGKYLILASSLEEATQIYVSQHGPLQDPILSHHTERIEELVFEKGIHTLEEPWSNPTYDE